MLKSRFWLPALALAGLWAFAPAFAQEPAADPAAKAAAVAPVAIEPKALTLLKDMSETLAKAGSIAFNVRRAFDEPAANGQPLFYTISSEVALQRPDKLKIITPGDGPASEFYYDGKEMAVFLPAANSSPSRPRRRNSTTCSRPPIPRPASTFPSSISSSPIPMPRSPKA